MEAVDGDPGGSGNGATREQPFITFIIKKGVERSGYTPLKILSKGGIRIFLGGPRRGTPGSSCTGAIKP